MNFLDKLDALMFEKGINKSVLSKESEIPYTTIDGWYKKGYEGVKLTTLKKIAAYFGTTLDFLVCDDITGRKSIKNDDKLNITEVEIELISAYRGADDIGKELILRAANITPNTSEVREAK